MDLTKVLFRPVRYTLSESLASVVAFDDRLQLNDYIFSTYNTVPHLRYYGYDERICWHTYIALDDERRLPIGYVHIPYGKLHMWCN